MLQATDRYMKSKIIKIKKSFIFISILFLGDKRNVPEGPVALVSAGPPPRIRFLALSWVKLGADSAVISSSSDGDENSGRRVSAKSNGADDASSRLVVRTV